MSNNYYCKWCTTYVRDTAFERKQHESTSKHQYNLKRFLQGIQKDHLKTEREKERTKAEIERLNRITSTQSRSEGSTSSAASTRNPSKTASTAPSAVDQKRQWAQLAEMGIAVPDHARAEMAMPGEWQTVGTRKTEPDEQVDDKLVVGVKKRKLDAGDEDEEDLEDVVQRKGWGARFRQYPAKDDGPSQDLDALLAGKLSNPTKISIKHEIDPGNQPFSGDLPEQSVKHESDGNDGHLRLDSEERTSLDIPSHSSVAKENTETKSRQDAHDVTENVPVVPVFKKRKAKATSIPPISQG